MTKNGEVGMSVIDLTPEMAEALLARQIKNRPFSTAKLRDISTSISEGEWVLNGESIKVDSRNRMIDGQHRCQAVVNTGVSIKTCMIRGVDPAAFDTLDTGKRRSVADVFSIDNEASAVQLSSLIRALHYYEDAGHGIPTRSVRTPLSNHHARQILRQNPEIREHVRWHSRVKPAALRRVPVTFIRYITRGFGDKGEPFWRAYKTGLGLSSGSPAYRLREKYLRHATARPGSQGRLSSREIYAYAVIAWNAHVRGADTKALKWHRTPGKHDQLPKIITDPSLWSEDR